MERALVSPRHALPLFGRPGIQLEETIAARYALREGSEAFARATKGGTWKVLLSA